MLVDRAAVCDGLQDGAVWPAVGGEGRRRLEDVEARPAEHLVTCVTEDVLRGLVPADDRARLADDEGALAGSIEDVQQVLRLHVLLADPSPPAALAAL